MLFEQQQKSYRSSKLISGHPQAKRCSRRQSKLVEFKILNPLTNYPNYSNNTFIPTVPTSIKNQLEGMEYLTLNAVNNIGKTQPPIQSTFTKRNSRFSKRLMAMQKALQMQEMKFQNIDSQKCPQTFYVEQQQQNEGNYLSMMEEEKNSLDMQFVLHDNLDRDIELDMGLSMCDEENYDTEVEFYSQTEIRHINYEEYQSYLNV